MSSEPNESHEDCQEAPPGASKAELDRLEHYKILRCLGESTVGTAYLAYDERLDRKVTIKLLNSTSGKTPRLEREAQALARLSHPAIVQVYEIGEYEDAPFVVMEFVKGVSLGEWLAVRERSRAEILKVFIAAGKGLAAAHEKQLVHRDFKPENVMVCSDDRVVVTDFGLAYAQGDHELSSVEITRDAILSKRVTMQGSIQGTPAYMSPEQYKMLQTDARSDQFSFCVALWEALYGQNPFPGSNYFEQAKAVTAAEPRAGKRRVPGWLRKAMLRGLAKEPGRRWPTMNELLAALEADPTRRRWLVGGVALALGLAGAAAAFVSMIPDTEHDQALAACEEQAGVLSESWSKTREELEGAIADADAWAGVDGRMEGFVDQWTEMRRSTCVAGEVDQTLDRTSHDLIVACLDDGRAELEALLEIWTDSGVPPEKLSSFASRASYALPLIEMCKDPVWTERYAEGSVEPAARETLDKVRENLFNARAQESLGKLDKAKAYAERAVDAAKNLQDQSPGLLAEAQLARARLALGRAYAQLGEDELAREQLDEARKKSGRDNKVVIEARTWLIRVIGVGLGDTEEGLFHAKEARIEIEKSKLLATPYEAEVEVNAGRVHAAAGNYDEALEAYGRALKAYADKNHPAVGEIHDLIGLAHAGAGDHQAALDAHLRALDNLKEALGEGHAELAEVWVHVGDAHLALGEAMAVNDYKNALKIGEASLGPDDPGLVEALLGLARAQMSRESYEEARGQLERARALAEEAGRPQVEVAQIQFLLAQVLWHLGQRGPARETARAAAAVYRDGGEATAAELELVEGWIKSPGRPAGSG